MPNALPTENAVADLSSGAFLTQESKTAVCKRKQGSRLNREPCFF